MRAPRIVVEDSTGQLLDTAGEVTFGTRLGCSVVLDDAIAGERHCQVLHDGRFAVRDLGTVSGTWLDGSRVDGVREVRDGSQMVFGASRALARIEDRDGSPTLVLQLQRNGFWWRKAGKKVFDNDPDALVRSEVGFGAFPLLRVANRLAIVAGTALLLAAIFVAAVLEPLADAGPLATPHALVTSGAAVAGASTDFGRCQRLADAQGCNVCHEVGAGTPPGKCVQCHEDFVADGKRRHPYLGDGLLGPLPGIPVDAGLCVVCHTEHQGSDWLKPAAAALLGACETCHGSGQTLATVEQRVPPQPPPPQQLAHATYSFPHAPHLAKGIECAACHRIDPAVQRDRERGVPDDPARQDFATVPFETCAPCHVQPGAGSDVPAQPPPLARPQDQLWTVAWHGTDEGGKHCRPCHAETTRGGRTVFGPEGRTVARPVRSASLYAAERARYTVTTRSHQEQFAQHAQGQQCVSCHRDGAITAGAQNPPRVFWHALHLAEASLQPAAGQGGAVSNDATAGCVSCHQDMRAANALVDATKAAYHWPTTDTAQAACKECHREGERALPLQAITTTIPAERRAAAIDFPHGVHVASPRFGQPGPLAEGCFACHGFEAADGNPLQLVPSTLPKAADCTQCHSGHAHVGGGDCQKCHPAEPERSNSFLLAAAVAPGTLVAGRQAPAEPTRAWPGANGFSHLSRGHVGDGITCATCHDAAAVGQSKSLADVPVPDEAAKACRECHLRKQFHWR